MSCDCFERANEALAPHNTRIEMLMRFGPGTLRRSWPISTVQLEKGRGKAKAMGLVASFCPMCGADLSNEDDAIAKAAGGAA